VPAGVGDVVAAVVIGVVATLVIALLIVFFLPLDVFVFEALVVAVAAVVLGRPWARRCIHWRSAR